VTPSAPAHDVLGIGNAIVDVLSQADEAFVAEHGIARGTMTLIDAAGADALYGAMGPGVEVSGGSCANTMAGAASFGARAAYIGKVRDDQLGAIFAHDLRAAGVAFATPPAAEGPGTARCLILVTPDGERTMCTYLGACVELGPEDVDEALVASAAVTYLEGYLWDPPRAKEAFRKAMAAARRAGRRVALTLSDPFCVDRHRDEFRALVDGEVDVLFANEAEILALTEAGSLEEAVAGIAGRCEIAAITRSERGSLIVAGDERHEVPAVPVERVVDTTGAGDLYAAGFLHGLTRGLDLPTCARLGSLAASEVISHFGARPEVSLADLAAPLLAGAEPATRV
jgi:sugar/nucleoside kinase (ribokinase family)